MSLRIMVVAAFACAISKATNLAFGDRLAFERNDVVDWSYRKGGRTIGNYTACALMQHKPPQQRDAFIRENRLDCPD